MNFVDAEIIKDGKSYKVSNNELTDTSLEVSSFIVGSIKKQTNYVDDIDGRSRVNYYSDDKYRTIKLIIISEAYDMQDIAHLRDKVNELFDGVFHIREMRNNNVEVEYEQIGQSTDDLDLGDSDYTDGRQYKVECVSEIEIDDLMQSSFEVELETVELPYGETIYTTLELHDTRYIDEVDTYGLVDGIHDEKVNYRVTDKTFNIYNAGNAEVKPETMYLKITVNGIVGNDGFSLKNKTTNQTFTINGSLNGTLILEGIDVKLNNLNVLRDTNFVFLKLAKGDNHFEILKGDCDSIDFDFRFYYK